MFITLSKLKEVALKAKYENKHIYLIKEDSEIKIQRTSKFLHHDSDFNYIVGLTPDGILQDYGIYNGWETSIEKILKEVNTL
ncbi:hypothetical protein ANABIO32_00400 [Rossellomorea marisflavi]|uniref:hypothetical protein n=1 Tax=Rossellomorea marisflavi TaxID=189381 RepID=UPI0025C87819|nr:hypothetical protein [Rossellomorea marisflavi]GLI82354.1 hypothetical protein ANABIO32_00400 [Rossellomorea marisflavi]